jgi:hypothetical protein
MYRLREKTDGMLKGELKQQMDVKGRAKSKDGC